MVKLYLKPHVYTVSQEHDISIHNMEQTKSHFSVANSTIINYQLNTSPKSHPQTYITFISMYTLFQFFKQLLCLIVLQWNSTKTLPSHYSDAKALTH